ncbi:hypothetical protein ACIBSW_34620 [Actinoplanes sp. NPDC049668]|uniref:hypothetical protein n=1 Tax=unclassified Actinoplanes TaxID=2626549 RepID=UPI0033A061E2
MATTTRTRKTAAVATVELVEITTDLKLEPGVYVKVGTRRIGTAHLTIAADGTLAYTNRRSEIFEIDAKKFMQVWKTGINSKVA